MSNNMHKSFPSIQSLARLGLFASLALGVASCGSGTTNNGTDDAGTAPDLAAVAPATTGPAIGFNHDGTLSPTGELFANGQQIPIKQTEVTHSCGKITYATLGRLLSSRGVATTVGTQCTDAAGSYDCTAGSLYTNGNLILGIANYPARASESPWNTTGGIVRLQDIMVAASEALIVAGTNPSGAFAAGTACAGTALFSGTGAATTCNADGFACLLGVPLTAGQQGLCNGMVTDPSYTDPMLARRHTVAALASTIHLCD